MSEAEISRKVSMSEAGISRAASMSEAGIRKITSGRDAVIVSGGNVDQALLKDFLRDLDHPFIIAADRGLAALRNIEVYPDHMIGDYDSSDQETYEYAKSIHDKMGIALTKLNPIKDDTDTEAALSLALRETDGRIYIFGGTGSRLDHVIANIAILVRALEEGREAMLLDSNNRIRLVDRDHAVRIRREDAFGDYLSIFPYGMEARGVTATGVFYPLLDVTLRGNSSLGTSNEIIEEFADISVKEGILILIESKD